MNKRKLQSPRLARYLFSRMKRYQEDYSILNDVEEVFDSIYESKGYVYASLWYWYQCIFSSCRYFNLSLIWSMIMFSNYVKIAVRNIKNNKIYSFINITGLSLGIASSLLILTYVNFQFSFDKFHDKSDRIFRFSAIGTEGDHPYSSAGIPAFVSEYILNNFPEAESVVRFAQPSFDMFSYREKTHHEKELLYADHGVFEMFDFQLLEGDSQTALQLPYSIVMTEEMAYRYFPGEDPVGKQINAGENIELTVTGIVKKPPINSHLQFSGLISMETIKKVFMHAYEHKAHFDFYTYVLLGQEVDSGVFASKFDGFFEEHAGDVLAFTKMQLEVHLQPLTSIHLRSKLLYDNPGNTDIMYIYGLIASAVLILLIACINYVNLSTARLSNRYKEIGVRKVMGALKEQLVVQFMGESVFNATLAFLIGILLVVFAFPYLQYLTGYNLSILYLGNPLLIAQSLFILLLISFVSSGYPVFLLSNLKPARMLRGMVFTSKKNTFVRNSLVVFQFLISISLIIVTIGVFSQLNFLKKKSLGFDSRNLIYAPVYTDEMGLGSKEADYFVETFKREITALNGVESISYTDNIPCAFYRPLSYILSGDSGSKPVSMIHYTVEEDFINSLKLNITAGRGFSADFSNDKNRSIVINEAAAKLFGPVNPIGQTVKRENRDEKWTVIGVMQDIHSRSLHHEKDPMFFSVSTHYHYTVMRLKPGNTESTLANINEVWKRFDQVHPFEYRFMDDMISNLYNNERQLERIVQLFTLLAIIISSLGVFGFISYLTQQRIKEIGIRKTLGASTLSIIGIFVKNLAIWIITANVLAVPLGYYCIKLWLENFTYKITPGWEIFFLSGLSAFIIALLTVIVQTARAALTNPVDSLRIE